MRKDSGVKMTWVVPSGRGVLSRYTTFPFCARESRARSQRPSAGIPREALDGFAVRSLEVGRSMQVEAVALGGERLGFGGRLVGSGAHELEHRRHDSRDFVAIAAARQRSNTPGRVRDERFQLFLRGWPGPLKPQGPIVTPHVHPVQCDHMEVFVKIRRRPEPLNERDEAGLARGVGGRSQVSGELLEEDRERLRFEGGITRQAMVQIVRHVQHVLPQRHPRQDCIHQMRRGLGGPPRGAAGTLHLRPLRGKLRCLQENATSDSSPHWSQRMRRKPLARTPQSR